MVVTIGNHRACLSCTIAHCDRESYICKEPFYLRVKSSSTYKNFIEVSAQNIQYILTDSVLYLTVDNRHVHQQMHWLTLDFREYLLADNLLNNHRHGNNHCRLNVSTSLGDKRWTRQTGEEEKVITKYKLAKEFARKSIHVSHRQHAQNIAAVFYMRPYALESPLHIACHNPIRQHYALGESGGSTGIINHANIIGLVLEVVDMLLMEELRILMTIEGIEVLTSVCKVFRT